MPPSVHPDLVQEVVIAAWGAVRRGRLEWQYPPALRAFLRLTAARVTYRWWLENPEHVGLHEHDAANELDAERIIIAKRMLKFLREATTPERWRAVRAYALGVPVHAVAKREHCPPATIYDRMRRARLDFAAALRREDAAIYVRRKT